MNGKAKKMPRPAYPDAARLIGAEGPVKVEVTIAGDGKVFSAKALDGHPLLGYAAAEAACKSEFTPTRLSGKPIIVTGVITYNFRSR